MSALFPDTGPEAEQVLIELLRLRAGRPQAGDVGADECRRRVCWRSRGCGHAIPTPPRRNCSAILPTCCLERIWLPAPMGRGQRRSPMLPEPIAVTLLVIDALEQVGARYVIGGSLASTVHGVVRTTLDTDIVADLSLRQAQPFADLLAGAFYLDLESIRHAIRIRSSFNVIHLATMFKVDVFIPKDRPFDRQQLDIGRGGAARARQRDARCGADRDAQRASAPATRRGRKATRTGGQTAIAPR